MELEKRSVVLQSRVTPEEADYIKEVAESNGVTVSSLIRLIMVDFSD